MNRGWLGGIILATVVLATLGWWAWEPEAATSRALDAKSPAKIAVGAKIYAENCAACHGVNLEGQPNWREQLPEGGLPAPPHSDDGHTWHHKDQVLFDYTKQGGQALVGQSFKSNMPGFGEVLSDDEIWAVLSFIKSTWTDRVQDLHDQRNAATADQ